MAGFAIVAGGLRRGGTAHSAKGSYGVSKASWCRVDRYHTRKDEMRAKWAVVVKLKLDLGH